mmetsp:Transcript_33086/g.32464  ORF Transcript_33086/g.32464 Transcript_33086/m.32464 type:complete len:274 (+) Transcript_33086:1565-2386(+)
MISWRPQNSDVFEFLECVSFEQSHELLGHQPGSHFLVGPADLTFGCSEVGIPALGFSPSSVSGCFHSLSLHEFGFFDNEELLLVVEQLLFLPLFDDFDSGVLASLADQHLEDGFHFQFKIVEFFVIDLDFLVDSFFVLHEDWSRRLVDVVVGLELCFVSHILEVVELLPVVLVFEFSLSLVLLLFVFESFASEFFIPLLAESLHAVLPFELLFSLFLGQDGIWLQTRWDHDGSEGISSDNSSVVHDILGSNFDEVFVRVSSHLLTCPDDLRLG